MDIVQSLQDYFINAGFDDTFSQLIFAFAIFAFVISTHMILKAPMIVTMASSLMLFFIFVVIGIIPIWIVLVIGIGIFLLGFLTISQRQVES